MQVRARVQWWSEPSPGTRVDLLPLHSWTRCSRSCPHRRACSRTPSCPSYPARPRPRSRASRPSCDTRSSPFSSRSSPRSKVTSAAPARYSSPKSAQTSSSPCKQTLTAPPRQLRLVLLDRDLDRNRDPVPSHHTPRHLPRTPHHLRHRRRALHLLPGRRRRERRGRRGCAGRGRVRRLARGHHRSGRLCLS